MAEIRIYLDHSILDWMVKGRMGLLPNSIGSHTVVAAYSTVTLEEIQRSAGFEQQFLDVLYRQNAQQVDCRPNKSNQVSDEAVFLSADPRDVYRSHLDNQINTFGLEHSMAKLMQVFMGHAPEQDASVQMQNLLNAAQSILDSAWEQLTPELSESLEEKLLDVQSNLRRIRVPSEMPTLPVKTLDEQLVGGSQILNNLQPPDIVGQIWRLIPDSVRSNSSMEQFFGISAASKPSRAEKICAVYQTLNHVGYFRDRNLSKLPRMNSAIGDCHHAMYAGFCDALLTRDNGLAMKARAAYEFLDIPTDVRLIDS